MEYELSSAESVLIDMDKLYLDMRKENKISGDNEDFLTTQRQAHKKVLLTL